ncbi:MAG: arsenate reductase ArsC [Phycisphaerales bacterium]|nr:MAG: arsenate reductase ArsC [Phycisphaerales bacterium]
MSKKTTVLFLCTGNACRSQMAEALLRHLGGDRFAALSAGSQPAGFVHPLAEIAMERLNVPVADQTSKSWDVFATTPIDVVITLCDAAASETCPNWSSSPITAHWSLPDPTFHLGDEAERVEFAVRVATRLKAKIRGLVDLDWSADRDDLLKRLEFLGEI